MIVNIPKPEEYISTGITLLNVSWDTIINLLFDLEEASYFGVETDEVTEDFWKASKQHMMNAVSVVQQGVEFILKGKICEVSPFFLIADSSKSWPKRFSQTDTEFADFRTVDAQDLAALHDTVCSERMGDEFADRFYRLRQKRNAIVHSIDTRIDVQAIEVIIDILYSFVSLLADRSWIYERRRYLEKSPRSELHSPDWVEEAIVWEFSTITDILPPAEMMRFFRFNKRQRRYVCPECAHRSGDSELEPHTAILKPNKPKSTNLYCFVCGKDIPVVRNKCSNDECQGNVISVEYNICTTCGCRQ